MNESRVTGSWVTTGMTPFWSLGVFALAITLVYQLAKAPEAAGW